jgi:hypothetical protein
LGAQITLSLEFSGLGKSQISPPRYPKSARTIRPAAVDPAIGIAKGVGSATANRQPITAASGAVPSRVFPGKPDASPMITR